MTSHFKCSKKESVDWMTSITMKNDWQGNVICALSSFPQKLRQKLYKSVTLYLTPFILQNSIPNFLFFFFSFFMGQKLPLRKTDWIFPYVRTYLGQLKSYFFRYHDPLWQSPNSFLMRDFKISSVTASFWASCPIFLLPAFHLQNILS